jgi:EAL domain-containing protein (putative c-di-GMP-specific phosphodiesterase class I)/GGDEF domain-containing protein
VAPGGGQSYRWQGWNDPTAGSTPAVTSAPLHSQAPVQSRLFPKIRSWLALGAPLELLSPLSAVRALYALALVFWIVEVTAFTQSRESFWSLIGALVTAGTIWLVLLRVPKIGPRACWAALTFLSVAGLTLMATTSSAVVLASAALLFPTSAAITFFYGKRALFSYQGIVAAGLFAASEVWFGPGPAVLVAVAWSASMLLVSLVVKVLLESVGRSGTVDPETGIPNGLGLARRLQTSHKAEAEHSMLVVAAVLLAGVDDARKALGYRVGTELLRRVVEDLGQVVSPTTLVARVEGDELVVVQTVKVASGPPVGTGTDTHGDGEGSAPPEAQRAGDLLAYELARTVAAGRYLIDRVEVRLRAHVGLAFGTDPSVDPAEFVRRASLSAHRAAEVGETRAVWSGDTGNLTADDLALLADLRLADQRGELSLAYQPQVNAKTRKIEGVEALLRWHSPRLGSVSPGRFIVLAERTGLIEQLTWWVVAEALDAQARWRSAGIDCPVSVNLSPNMLGSPHVAVAVLGELRARNLPPRVLTVEVTETDATDLMRAIDQLRPLHDHGVKVSIDDFGTGYTSFAALPHLPLDEIKVDMSFVQRSLVSKTDEAIVRSIRDLAHRLGLTCVAEGVESSALETLMTDIGLDLLQGASITMPLKEDELLDFLRRHREGRAVPVDMETAELRPRRRQPTPPALSRVVGS